MDRFNLDPDDRPYRCHKCGRESHDDEDYEFDRLHVATCLECWEDVEDDDADE